MSLIEIIFLAIALSIDATVVSFSQGLIFKINKRKNSLLLAFFLGFFQALMPIIGFFTSLSVYKYLADLNKWIIFAIFIILGIKFIKEAFEENKQTVCCLSIGCLLTFAVATSIDALGAGVSLCFAQANIWICACIIGIITFINSFLGFWAGYLFKNMPAKYLEILGGLILIVLAINAIL